jgi:hypothetical protein
VIRGLAGDGDRRRTVEPAVHRAEEIMATNRASMSDTFVTTPRAVPDSDLPRRTVMVVCGVILALVSLAIGSVAIAQVWLAPSAAVDHTVARQGLQSWEALAMIVLGGLGFAGGAALVGIGMGRWTSPRPAENGHDYTGPGGSEDVRNRQDTPRVV